MHKDAWKQRNSLDWLLRPRLQLSNSFDMRALTSLTQTYLDINLDRDECRFNTAKAVHDELERALVLSENRCRRTFFDEFGYEVKADEGQEEEGKEGEEEAKRIGDEDEGKEQERKKK